MWKPTHWIVKVAFTYLWFYIHISYKHISTYTHLIVGIIERCQVVQGHVHSFFRTRFSQCLDRTIGQQAGWHCPGRVLQALFKSAKVINESSSLQYVKDFKTAYVPYFESSNHLQNSWITGRERPFFQDWIWLINRSSSGSARDAQRSALWSKCLGVEEWRAKWETSQPKRKRCQIWCNCLVMAYSNGHVNI